MRTRPRLTIPLATAVLAGSLLTTACDDASARRTTPPHERPVSRGIDARSYFEDYRSAADGDRSSAVGAPAPVTAHRAAGSAAGPGVPVPPIPVPQVPGPLDDNTFVDAGTSGFVDPERDPRSTFALDVDTGSWGVARTLLRQGYLPPPASIRPEEWVNALPVDPAEPEAGKGIAIGSATALAPSLDDGTRLVRVTVGTRPAAREDRRPVNVTLVVDRSGSMDIRERLGLVQSSLAVLADSLRDDDTVSVVSFEDRARPVLEPTPARETARILAAIEELTPGGSTNLEAGLRLGYQQARRSFRDDATNLVVLASDGVANVGSTGPGSIIDEIRSEGSAGIHLVTVGYGMGNYNDHLMEQLADLGDGFYDYVDDFAEAQRLFRDQLPTALVPVADDARVQVRFDPEAVASYRLVGYDNRAMADEDFADASADAGELGAGHHATALYEVRLRPGVEPDAVVGEAAVRWTTVGSGRVEQATTELLAGAEAQPTGDLALQAVVADLAQVLKHAAPYDDRAVTLADLGRRADALAAAGVPGGDEVRQVVRWAQSARPAPAPDWSPPPIR